MALTVRVRGQPRKLEIPWPRTCITVQPHRVFNREKARERTRFSKKKIPGPENDRDKCLVRIWGVE